MEKCFAKKQSLWAQRQKFQGLNFTQHTTKYFERIHIFFPCGAEIATLNINYRLPEFSAKTLFIIVQSKAVIQYCILCSKIIAK